MSNQSAYGKTQVTNQGYLDILIPQTVPASNTDILWEITNNYSLRPDLLANDLYGSKDLWWVFAQRNRSILKDPIYDFSPGTTIFCPARVNIDAALSTTTGS